MIRIVFASFIFCLPILVFGNNNSKNFQNKTKSKQSFVIQDSITTPNGYKKIDEVNGDLDKDGIDEKVIVYTTPREGDFGLEREIYIYKKRNNNWSVWYTSAGAILPTEHGGVMGDPFWGITIERGCIVIQHLGGSRQKWSYLHRFRFQNEAWQLIGATIVYGAPCDVYETYDYNVSTGKIVYTKELEDCDSGNEEIMQKIETRYFTHKLYSLPEMIQFYPGNTKITLQKSGLVFYY